MCPSWVLWRGVKVDVIQRNRKPEEKTEGLNRAIQIHVKDRILIVPHPSNWPCHFVTDEEFSIVSGIWLDLYDRGARIRPGLDSRLHSDRVTSLVKYEVRAAAYRKLLIGVIVEHVALIRVRLTPGKFMGADIGGFAIISRAHVLGWDQVSLVHQDPVRDAVVAVAAVIVGSIWERASERIDPCARANAVLITVQS